EGSAQEGSCSAYISFSHQLANARARNRLSAQAHLRVHNHLKTQLASKLREQVNVTRSFVPKMKVVAFVRFDCLEPVAKDLLHKIPGPHEGQIPREGQKQNRINSGLPHEPQLLWSRRQQLRRCIRTQNPHRMRLKCHRNRFCSALPRTSHEFTEHARVRPVHTIKIPHTDQSRSEG